MGTSCRCVVLDPCSLGHVPESPFCARQGERQIELSLSKGRGGWVRLRWSEGWAHLGAESPRLVHIMYIPLKSMSPARCYNAHADGLAKGRTETVPMFGISDVQFVTPIFLLRLSAACEAEFPGRNGCNISIRLRPWGAWVPDSTERDGRLIHRNHVNYCVALSRPRSHLWRTRCNKETVDRAPGTQQ